TAIHLGARVAVVRPSERIVAIGVLRVLAHRVLIHGLRTLPIHRLLPVAGTGIHGLRPVAPRALPAVAGLVPSRHRRAVDFHAAVLHRLRGTSAVGVAAAILFAVRYLGLAVEVLALCIPAAIRRVAAMVDVVVPVAVVDPVVGVDVVVAVDIDI